MTHRASLLLIGLCGLAVAGCKGPPVPILYDGLDKERYTRCALRLDGDKLYSSAYIDAPSTYPPGTEIQITMFSKQRIDMNLNGVPHRMFPADDEFNGGAVEVFLKKYTVDSLAELGLTDKKKKAAGGAVSPEGMPPAAPGGAGINPEQPTDRQPPAAGQPPEGQPAEPAGAGFKFDQMKKTTAGSVKRGLAAVGMTKEQVFMALGPPIFINFETPATNLPLDEVLKANRWVYYGSWWARAFTFGLASKRAYVFDSDGKLISVES